jgi:hypothetical protein
VVDVDAGEDRAVGVDEVDRVEPPAETDLEHQRVGRGPPEHPQDRQRGELEVGERHVAAGGLHRLELLDQGGIGRRLAVEPRALVEAQQVRRGVAADPVAGG